MFGDSFWNNVGILTVLVVTWSGIFYWMIEAKLKDKFYTKIQVEKEFYTKSEVHEIFISEKTHNTKMEAFEKVVNAKLTSLSVDVKEIKETMRELFKFVSK